MRAIHEEFFRRIHHHEANLTITEDAQLHRFLHESIFALIKRHLARALVRYLVDTDFLAPHCTEIKAWREGCAKKPGAKERTRRGGWRGGGLAEGRLLA